MIKQPPASAWNIQIADYILNLQSRIQQSDESKLNLVFLIGAPAGLEPPGNATEAGTTHLYLDPADCPPRTLSGNAWQIHCEESVAESAAFHGWAQQCTQLMIEFMLGPHLFESHINLMFSLLNRRTDERIVAKMVPLNQAEQLSQSLAGIPIEDVWVATFSYAPNMETYTRIAALFQDQIHPEAWLSSSAIIKQQGEESLLLLTTQASH